MLRSVRTEELAPSELGEIRALLDDAFVDDPLTPEDWEHCLGGVHVLAYDGPELTAHAAVVPRTFLLRGRSVSVGYVEGVGVARRFARRGFGRAVMSGAEAVIAAGFDFGALASSDEGLPFYEAIGWRRWQGRTYVQADGGLVRTPDEDDAIFVLGDVDVTADLACDWRPGDVW